MLNLSFEKNMNPTFMFKFFFKLSLCLLIISLISFYISHLKRKKEIQIQKYVIKRQELSTKWIVVTSVNNPTKQIQALAKQNGFKLLVVADLKTNPQWFYPNATFLSVNLQSSLNFKSAKTTPFNSYTRKNLGYLYAIQHGAQFIYDTDDDNKPINDLNSYFEFEQFQYELEYDTNSPRVLNPFAHFGQPTIWPRGFPLTQIKEKLYNNYDLVYKKTSYVQQGVVNGDPDVDAVFRLTKSSHKRFDIKFDDSAPSVRIPISKLAPFNSQNTLFRYEAFWGLYLPHSVSFRLTDIWRSYWCQRLLWLIDGSLSYYGPNVYQLRNAHSYLADFQLENEMYLKTSNLIDFLLEWNCTHKRFYSCVIDLSEKMAENNFWAKSEIESIRKWLNDLENINYKEPQIKNKSSKTIHLTKIKYTPEFQKPIDFTNYFNQSDIKFKSLDRLDTLEYFENYCSQVYKLNYSSKNFKKENTQKRNITLLVTFNHEAILKNIIFIKKFYQSYFKNIVFCGTSILNLTQTEKLKNFDSFTFIEYYTNFGYYHYYCMSYVIDMNLRTNGILLMSDDVLLKYWNLDILNENKIWFFKQLSCNHLLNSNVTEGIWMNTREGRSALKNVFSYMEKPLNSLTTKEKQIFKDYTKRLIRKAENSTKNEIKFCWMGGDIYYVPRKLYFEFNLIVKLFKRYDVFLEFAVPTILSGLDDRQEILNGKYYWTTYYDDDDYNKIVAFAHPFKLTHYNDLPKRSKMCRTFIQEKINDRF